VGLYVVGGAASIDNVVVEGDGVPDVYMDVESGGRVPTTWAALKYSLKTQQRIEK